MAEPGDTPRWRVRLETPVFVTVEPPSTAKGKAVPRSTSWASVMPTDAKRTPKEREHRMVMMGAVTTVSDARRSKEAK